jgi:hypothetical protein
MRASWLVGLLVVAAVSPLASAYITGITCAADTDGAVECASTWSWTVGGDLQTQADLNLKEKMYRTPAHVLGDVTLSDQLDPTIWILKTVENLSGQTWTGYHFNIFMDQPFSILATSQPIGWTAVVSGPSGPGTFLDSEVPTPRSWMYWGAVDYFVGTGSPIAPGDAPDFGAKVNFAGQVQFEVEQMYVVPEPVSMALLALGGLFLRRRK